MSFIRSALIMIILIRGGVGRASMPAPDSSPGSVIYFSRVYSGLPISASTAGKRGPIIPSGS